MCDLGLSPPLKLSLPSSGLLRSVMWFDTDLSGPHIGPIFMGFADHDRPFKMGHINSTETSVSNHLTLPYNPEDERLRSWMYLHPLAAPRYISIPVCTLWLHSVTVLQLFAPSGCTALQFCSCLHPLAAPHYSSVAVCTLWLHRVTVLQLFAPSGCTALQFCSCLHPLAAPRYSSAAVCTLWLHRITVL